MSIHPKELASRIRDAREAAGLSQEEVATHLDLSRSSVAQMELGNRAVSSLELDRLARLYGRDIRDFFAEEFEPEESLVAVLRAQVVAHRDDTVAENVRWCIDLARELGNLERLLEIDRDRVRAPEYPAPVLRTKWQSVQQGVHAAEAERKRLNLGDRPLGDVADLLESQGVRTALLYLPDDISGLTLMEPSLSFFVVANRGHKVTRRRFSWIHEYAHILFDRDLRGTVSRVSERDELSEVRANAFAAAFLLPEDGVHSFIEGIGKGRGSRQRWDVYDESDEGEVIPAEGRSEPGSQQIQLYDVILLAHRYRVSRTMALYRLKNVGLLSPSELDSLLVQEKEHGGKLERSLGLPAGEEPAQRGEGEDFRTRFLALALEAYRRGKISRGKLRSLAKLVRYPAEDLAQLLWASGVEEDEEDEVLLPGA
jgi:Zn-dependent peptidase ImmA (M78 family)/transcriptional regulator with XRE-family HTH domain